MRCDQELKSARPSLAIRSRPEPGAPLHIKAQLPGSGAVCPRLPFALTLVAVLLHACAIGPHALAYDFGLLRKARGGNGSDSKNDCGGMESLHRRTFPDPFA
jgi:hypothetical protein